MKFLRSLSRRPREWKKREREKSGLFLYTLKWGCRKKELEKTRTEVCSNSNPVQRLVCMCMRCEKQDLLRYCLFCFLFFFSHSHEKKRENVARSANEPVETVSAKAFLFNSPDKKEPRMIARGQLGWECYGYNRSIVIFFFFFYKFFNVINVTHWRIFLPLSFFFLFQLKQCEIFIMVLFVDYSQFLSTLLMYIYIDSRSCLFFFRAKRSLFRKGGEHRKWRC